ncbi:MAG: hypothetical protein Q9203_004863 [Teloschistes exilis]
MAPQKTDEAMAHTMQHSPEYYLQIEDNLNVLELTRRVYRRGIENMLSLVKKILSVHPEEPFSNPPRHLDQYSVRLLRLASEGAQEQPGCAQFLANILKRLVPRAEAGDRLSPDGSADQEPNAWGIPVASPNKPSLTMIHVRQRLAIAHNLRKEKKEKPVLHTEDKFELLKTPYTPTRTTFPH